MTRTIFLDLDGTLVDPRQGITASICYALERMGRPVPEPDSLLWCIGPPLQQSLVKLLGEKDPQSCAQALAFYRERYSATGLYECQPYTGIHEAIGVMRELGAHVYVATSKPRIYAEKIVENVGISSLVDGVFGCELDGRRSDKGDLLQHCLVTLGIGPARCIMVGDREHDVIGARRSRIPCVGVLYGYGSREELLAAGASALAEWPRELPSLCLAQINIDSLSEPRQT